MMGSKENQVEPHKFVRWQVILNGAPIIDCESETEMADKLLALSNLGVFGTFDTREVKCKDCADHLLGCPVCTDQPAPAAQQGQNDG